MPGPYGYTADIEKRVEARALDGCEACGCVDDRFRVVTFERPSGHDDDWTFEVECGACSEHEAEVDEAEVDAHVEDLERCSEIMRRVLALLRLDDTAWRMVSGFAKLPPLEDLVTRADGLETAGECYTCGRSRSGCVCSTTTLIEEDDDG